MIRNVPLPHPCLLGLLLVGCPIEEKPVPPPAPLSERVTWEGRQPLAYAVDSAPAGAVGDEAVPIRKHSLVFQEGDTLLLAEFAREDQAYRRFQAKAEPWEIREGAYRGDSGLVFIHGTFLGEMRMARPGHPPGTFLRERLAFQGEELFRRPLPFQSFPVAGQIPHSERVVPPDFLGFSGPEPVFMMRYFCRGDTAILFRAFPQSEGRTQGMPSGWKGKVDTLKWGREMRFSGLGELERPLEFWIFRGGYVGVEGCHDRKLAQDYAEKMRKLTVLIGEP